MSTRLLRELGLTALLSLAVLLATAGAFILLVRPLEERSRWLDRELDVAAGRRLDARLEKADAQPRAHRVAKFYRFFDRPEQLDTWLAKLYAIAQANGMELRSGQYRQIDSKFGLERLQISVPISGTYSQVRTFSDVALAELPVASLDRVSLRRKAVSDTRIEAELIFSVHLAKK